VVDLAPYPNTLEGVVALSSVDVWAAGWGHRNGKERTLIDHWDGVHLDRGDEPEPHLDHE